jgi:HK97 family phage portal protein
LFPSHDRQGGEVAYYLYEGEKIEKEDVLHIKLPNIIYQSNYGLSPLHSAIMVYTSSNNSYEANAWLLQNRGISGILSNKDANMPMLSEDQDILQGDWDLRTAGANKAGGIYVSSQSLDYLSLSMTPNDLRMIENKLSDLRTICSVYGMDSAMFNDPDNKTYSNRREAEVSMYTNVILPLSEFIYEQLSKWLIVDNFGIDGKIVMDKDSIPALSAPNLELSQKVVNEVNAGIITAEEARMILYPNLDENV